MIFKIEINISSQILINVENKVPVDDLIKILENNYGSGGGNNNSNSANNNGNNENNEENNGGGGNFKSIWKHMKNFKIIKILAAEVTAVLLISVGAVFFNNQSKTTSTRSRPPSRRRILL